MEEEHFYSKVVGSTFCGGQDIIKELSQGDTLLLFHDKNNEFDENAVAVYTTDAQRIGYLPRETASSVVEFVDQRKLFAEVSEITGGEGNKDRVGCNIKISFING